MTDVSIFVRLAGIPVSFLRIDMIRAIAHFSGPLNIIKYEKFVFRTEICHVGNTRGFQVGFCATCNRTWIPLVTFAGSWFDNITGDIDCRLIGEWIQYRAIGVRH